MVETITVQSEEKKTMAQAIFMVGGPGAGKSTVIKAKFAALKVVDCDKHKMVHPDYDPKNPSALHAWSSQQAKQELAETMTSGVDFVYDSTGTNAEKIVSMIRQAQSLGYTTKVVYVACSLAVALERNAKRARTVDEYIVREKHALVATSFEIISRYADAVEVVNN